MAIERRLLDILCCPTTKVPVRLLNKDMLVELNRVISEDKLTFRDGSPVKAPVQEALITDDNRTVFTVEDGIPIMLDERSIATDQDNMPSSFRR